VPGEEDEAMKSGLSLALMVCLVGSAMPVDAQEQTSAIATVTSQQAGKPADSDWSRVRKLRPGTEIIVTAKGIPPSRRYVVQVDGSGLTVLNLSDPTLSNAERGMLRAAASNHPDYLLAVPRGGGNQLGNNVRIGPAGVIVAGRKVAEPGQIVESTARADVVRVAIKRIRRTRTHGSVEEIARGAFVGFLVTAVAAGNGGTGPNYCTEAPRRCSAVIGLGTIAGGAAGYFIGHREMGTEDVIIYSVP
jgi:hypothetical protein